MMQEDLLKPCAGIQAPNAVAPIVGLPPAIAAWLQAEHEQLANALTRAHTSVDASMDDEPMLAIEELPEVTRKFLWRGMRRHHPGLAALVRDPNVLAMRATFGARLHLRVSDLAQVICASAPALTD